MSSEKKPDRGGPAFPCPMGEDWPECDRGMTLLQYYAGKLTAAWTIALAARRGEPGYSDESAAIEAARLGAYQAKELIVCERGQV